MAPRPRTSATPSSATRGSKRSTNRGFDASGVLQKGAVFEHFKDGQGGLAGHRVAGVGSAEAAGVNGVHKLGAAGGGRERQAGAECLGGQRDVAGNALVLGGEQRSGAAHAGLDLVDDQHDSVARRDLPKPFEEAGGLDNEAALALDRLDDHGCEVSGAVFGQKGLDLLEGLARSVRGGVARAPSVRGKRSPAKGPKLSLYGFSFAVMAIVSWVRPW